MYRCCEKLNSDKLLQNRMYRSSYEIQLRLPHCDIFSPSTTTNNVEWKVLISLPLVVQMGRKSQVPWVPF